MRAYWLAKFIRLYIIYDKFPWELGYKPYVEFDSIFPFILKELGKKMKHDRDVAKDFEKMKQGGGS